ncbi:hypothetical protein D3C78_1703430 [compost metagenome]
MESSSDEFVVLVIHVLLEDDFQVLQGRHQALHLTDGAVAHTEVLYTSIHHEGRFFGTACGSAGQGAEFLDPDQDLLESKVQGHATIEQIFHHPVQELDDAVQHCQ